MDNEIILYLGTSFLFIAIIHTFFVKKIEKASHNFPHKSAPRIILHLLSEVELVVFFWALIAFICFSLLIGGSVVFGHLLNIKFNEAIFIFFIMIISSTEPIIKIAEKIIFIWLPIFPFNKKQVLYFSIMMIGPTLGSIITEPAAMTLSALILFDAFFKKDNYSTKFTYASFGLLLVNISIGGTLTHFAAPPVVMIAEKWSWGSLYMFTHFGYKALISIFISTFLTVLYFRSELQGELKYKAQKVDSIGITVISLLFLFLTVFYSHQISFLAIIFIAFLIFIYITRKRQKKLKLKSAFFVSLFLIGLIYLGEFQAWWINLILIKLSTYSLFFGSLFLTSVTDNALITYLGTFAKLSETSKYFLLAGAVSGGGLTIIANAPNPIGLEILKDSFKEAGFNPIFLVAGAFLPTLIATICFIVLP